MQPFSPKRQNNLQQIQSIDPTIFWPHWFLSGSSRTHFRPIFQKDAFKNSQIFRRFYFRIREQPVKNYWCTYPERDKNRQVKIIFVADPGKKFSIERQGG